MARDVQAIEGVCKSRKSGKRVIAKDCLTDSYFIVLVREASQIVSQLPEFNQDKHYVTSSSSSSFKNDPPIDSEPTTFEEQPKRPMNAFMVWGQAIRRNLHDKYSNVQNALLSKALGRVWQTLDQNLKQPFAVRANKIKARHKLKYPHYRYQPRRLQSKPTSIKQQVTSNSKHERQVVVSLNNNDLDERAKMLKHQVLIEHRAPDDDTRFGEDHSIISGHYCQLNANQMVPIDRQLSEGIQVTSGQANKWTLSNGNNNTSFDQHQQQLAMCYHSGQYQLGGRQYQATARSNYYQNELEDNMKLQHNQWSNQQVFVPLSGAGSKCEHYQPTIVRSQQQQQHGLDDCQHARGSDSGNLFSQSAYHYRSDCTIDADCYA